MIFYVIDIINTFAPERLNYSVLKMHQFDSLVFVWQFVINNFKRQLDSYSRQNSSFIFLQNFALRMYLYAKRVPLFDRSHTPYIQTTKNHARKARNYKPKSFEWNNSAIEVKKKRGRKRKFLSFHTPSTGPHQLQFPSQPNGKNGNKG